MYYFVTLDKPSIKELQQKALYQKTAIWPRERPDLPLQSQKSQCVLNWISPEWDRSLFALCGPRVGPLGFLALAKQTKSSEQTHLSHVLSFHWEKDKPPPASHQPLPPTLTSGHKPTHRGSNYPYPIVGWPCVLDPKATKLFCPSSRVERVDELMGWGTGTQSKMAVLV